MVNDGNITGFFCEILGKVATNFAGTENDDFHGCMALAILE